MARTLNESEPYEQILPPQPDGTCFRQHGVSFDGQKREIGVIAAPTVPKTQPHAPAGTTPASNAGNGEGEGPWANWRQLGPFDANMKWPDVLQLAKQMKKDGAITKSPRNREDWVAILEELEMLA